MNTHLPAPDKPSTPKTFIRGLIVMEAVHKAGRDGIRIPEIARRTGIQRSTVYRYLDALIQMNYVHVNAETQTYVFNDSRFVHDVTDTHSLDALKRTLRRTSDRTGDSSFLVRRDKGDSVCVHRELGSYPLQVLAVTIGHRQPMGVGAAGLALLSNLHQNDINDVLQMNESRLAAFGGMTREQMERLIRSTRERGWSAVGNAAVPGILGVGIPVPREAGDPVYAISVSSVMERMPLKRQRFVIDVIRQELKLAMPSIRVNP